MRASISSIALLIIYCLLILLFSYTGFSKLIDFKNSLESMNRQPFPDWMSIYILIGVIVSEAIAVILLIKSSWRLYGLYLSFGLMLAFTIYVFLAVLGLYENRPCSCGGVIKHMTWNQHLYFNLFFLAISVIGIFIAKSTQAIKGIDVQYDLL